MAVAAELTREALAVPELLIDEEIRRRAGQFIGAALLGASETVELCSVEQPIESLHDALKLAKTGDKRAHKLVETNVHTDMIERTIKTGHVMSPVPLVVTEQGKIVQFGQELNTVQANSLRLASDHPVMRERTEAEARNAFRIEDLNRRGYLDDYSFVVFSRAENLPEYGFFTETMSCAIQVTSKHGDGLQLESAFVSGVAEGGGEQHDAEAIVKLAGLFGIDLEGKTPAEIIDTPLLIPSRYIQDGVLDLVRLYDECAGGTFFGEYRELQDYDDYRELCRQRERTFAPRVQAAKRELISASDQINSPVEAAELLHALSELHMVEHSVTDSSIDLRVFGAAAVPFLEEARQALEAGDTQKVEVLTEKAAKVAESNSCPNGRGGGSAEGESPKGDDEDCEFTSKQCPLCGQKNVKTKVKKIKGTSFKRISGSCHCSKIARSE